jgi:hypothetical protein
MPFFNANTVNAPHSMFNNVQGDQFNTFGGGE